MSVWTYWYLFYIKINFICLYKIYFYIKYFILCINQNYLFCCSKRSNFGHWERFHLAPVSLQHTSSFYFLSTFLLFWHCKILHTPNLCFLCYLSKDSWFLLLEKLSISLLRFPICWIIVIIFFLSLAYFLLILWTYL